MFRFGKVLLPLALIGGLGCSAGVGEHSSVAENEAPSVLTVTATTAQISALNGALGTLVANNQSFRTALAT